MDLIDRQAAIKAICEDGTWLESQGCTDISMAERKQRDADILSDLPSAQTERKNGKWIVSHIPDSMLWECNQCGFDCGAHSFNFCPNCGADMRGEQDG